MKTKKESRKTLSLSGQPISSEELKKEIKGAEKGPFFSIEKSKKIISQWREQNHSL
jgi:hypothetical protein